MGKQGTGDVYASLAKYQTAFVLYYKAVIIGRYTQFLDIHLWTFHLKVVKTTILLKQECANTKTQTHTHTKIRIKNKKW